MAAGGLKAPPRATVALESDEDHLEIRSTWPRHLRSRVGLLVLGLIWAGMWGFPAWDMEEGTLLPLFLGLMAAGGVVFGLWGLVRPIPRVHVRIRPESVDVLDGPSHLIGTHPRDRVAALVDTSRRLGSAGDEQTAEEGTGRVIGLHLQGQGTLPFVYAGGPETAAEILAPLGRLLDGGREPLPVWPSAPAVDARLGLAIGSDGSPAGWPSHPGIEVDQGPDRIVLKAPAPGRDRKLKGYATALGPFLLATAGLVAVSLASQANGWVSWLWIFSGEGFAAAILGGWLVAGLAASRSRLGWTHMRLAKGPYRLVVEADRLTVQAQGRQVLDQVPTAEIRGLLDDGDRAAVLTADDEIELPLAGIVDDEQRAWALQGFAYALDHVAGRRLPDVAAAAGGASQTTGPTSAVSPDA